MQDLYTPILRWKQGEKICLRELPKAIKSRIFPCISLRDPGGKVYFGDREDLTKKLGQELGQTPFYLNLPLLDCSMSSADLRSDLAIVIDIAREHRHAVPTCEVVNNSSLEKVVSKFKKIPSSMAFRIRPTFDFELDAEDFVTTVSKLAKYGLITADLLVDRGSNGNYSSKSLRKGLIKWASSGQFRRIVLISGTMPNNFEYGSHKFNRPDAASFQVVRDLPRLSNLSFGDYGVLSPDWREPGGGRGGPPTTYRYTTDDSWLVWKDQNGQGPALAQLITMHGAYRGATYSPGDREIQNRSKGKCGVGTAVNHLRDSMSQHIVFVAKNLN